MQWESGWSAGCETSSRASCPLTARPRARPTCPPLPQKEMGPLGRSPGGGFEFVNEQTKKSSEKWGWVAREPGARVSFVLDTRIGGRSRRRAAAAAAGGPAAAEEKEDQGAAAATAEPQLSLRQQWAALVEQQQAEGAAPVAEEAAVAASGEDTEESEGEVFARGGPGEPGAGGAGAGAARTAARVQVLMGYLKSYEHMGTATVSCAANCRWAAGSGWQVGSAAGQPAKK